MQVPHQPLSADLNLDELKHRWLALANGHPPEWIASYVASPGAACVVTTTGYGEGGEPCSAWLESMAEVPYWAFALAKSSLDDVGEWPLVGMQVEYALLDYEQHRDPGQALAEIVAAIKTVWNEVEVVYVGEGRQ
ncbi:MAG: hypothetical protein HQL84_09545 [Magnetococcales bacterium]|nr:hypothetical protein [Magnetococcales bacterium]MBF0150276.1 hypothetical protein [Magnetococcales bacterium]MBF0172142.1 hypothetical protein [Magnetococcales bacterium]MBF0347942.1 hypothetical protein [Magnetococcales bacterium]MBF0632934.1 hypothetical protein [Magnetococcales bacterium]